MADNISITAGSGTNVATDQLPSGAHVQYVKLLDGTADGTGAIAGDAANGLDVDVTRLPALVAGTALIGKVQIRNAADSATLGDSSNPLVVSINGTPGVSISGTATVSGTVTANIGTTNGLALDATLTGGTQKSLLRGAAKGTTSAGDVTSVATDANTQSLHVHVANTAAISGSVSLNAGSNAIGSITNTSFIATQATAANLNMTVGNASGASAVNIQDGGNSITVDGTVSLGTGANAIGSITNTSFAATQATASSLNAQIVGNVASAATDSGNPVKIGGVARTANPTAATDGQRMDLMVDKVGRIVVTDGQIRTLRTSGTATITSTTETTILAAGGAGVFHDIYLITMANTSASAVRVDIRDVAAGSVIYSIYLAAGGGAIIQPSRELAQTTANSAWTATLSAAVTDVRVAMFAVKNV